MGGRIWKWDTYDIRKYEPWSIRNVLDIGANVGGFALMCRVLFPVARTYAIEPNLDAFNVLKNTAGVYGVKCYNLALGIDNVELYSLAPEGTPVNGYSKFFTKEELGGGNPSYSIKSYSLPSLITKFKIEKEYPYIIKVDCEGGEKYILRDEKSIESIRDSVQTCMELHFTRKDKIRGGTSKEWWDFLNLFNDTHHILLCERHYTDYRRYYIYRPFEFSEIEGGRACQIELLRFDWWKYKLGTPRSDGVYEEKDAGTSKD